MASHAAAMLALKRSFHVESNRAAFYDYHDNALFTPMKSFLRHCPLRRALDTAIEVPLVIFKEFYDEMKVDKQAQIIRSQIFSRQVQVEFTQADFVRCFKIPTYEAYEEANDDAEILDWLRSIGYMAPITKLTEYRKSKMPALFNFYHYYIMRCLTGKVGSFEQSNHRMLQVMFGLCTGKHLDYGSLLWTNMIEGLSGAKTSLTYQRFLAVLLSDQAWELPQFQSIVANCTPAELAEVQFITKFKINVNDELRAQPQILNDYMLGVIALPTDEDFTDEDMVSVEDEAAPVVEPQEESGAHTSHYPLSHPSSSAAVEPSPSSREDIPAPPLMSEPPTTGDDNSVREGVPEDPSSEEPHDFFTTPISPIHPSGPSPSPSSTSDDGDGGDNDDDDGDDDSPADAPVSPIIHTADETAPRGDNVPPSPLAAQPSHTYFVDSDDEEVLVQGLWVERPTVPSCILYAQGLSQSPVMI